MVASLLVDALPLRIGNKLCWGEVLYRGHHHDFNHGLLGNESGSGRLKKKSMSSMAVVPLIEVVIVTATIADHGGRSGIRLGTMEVGTVIIEGVVGPINKMMRLGTIEADMVIIGGVV